MNDKATKQEALRKLMEEQELEALRGSIEHWKRMISWAEHQDDSNFVNPVPMRQEIQENWFAEFCPLCELEGDDCEDCLLTLAGKCCEREGSPWTRVNLSATWFEWLENARIMLKTLEDIEKVGSNES